ncbi:MAG: DNA polymerase III subunit gamma and tau [Mycobacteriales bacterium]|nr:DNA polymerase III subunit gamma and tau [Frankia sp.]
MSLALYRKYRPQTFAEVVGQEHVTDALQQALRNNRVHHAYLFSGPRGCGKTSSARILAKSLNCESGPTPEPCGVCDQCVAITEGRSLDVVELDAASHGGVDDARDLRERAFFAPASARYKVYIVDEAHMVSREGFNALLKVVEEPPDYLKFVFATTEPDKVISTIKSRTHHYPFRLLPPRVLNLHLAAICEREGIEVDPRALPLVVRSAAGSARDAMSLLDQLMAGAGDAGVTYDRALSLLGVSDLALLDEVVDALAANDGAAVFTAVNRLVEAGHDPQRFAKDLLERLRDLIVVQAVPDAAEAGMIDYPVDQLAQLARQASSIGAADLARAAELVHAGLTEMRGTTSPRLMLEVICARILLPAASDDGGAVAARVDRLERRLSIAPEPRDVSSPAAAPASTQRKPASQPAAPAEAAPAAVKASPPAVSGIVDAAGVRRVWPEILDAVSARKKTTRALLADAQVVAVDGGAVTLEFRHSFHARSLAEGANIDHLRDAMREVLGIDVTVQATVAGAGEQVLTAADAEPRFAPGDAPADDEEPASVPSNGAASGEDAAVAVLKSRLGATVIEEAPR